LSTAHVPAPRPSTSRLPLATPVLAAAVAAFLIASVGALVTDLGPWYLSLKQPAWKPPDWLFGPAWTLIFGLAAIAGVYAWTNAPSAAARRQVVAWFSINAFFNILWSALFFRFARPDWALLEVVFLWLSIAMIIMIPGRYSRVTSWLMVPYLAWVTVAGLLNLAVVRLNAPFS
jgi:tryptophan-rich sensory protein